ncbi:M18 family aminopeptidase [Brevibacterium samyangense]|uniref:M18 family aminopeptidase n=1 Tax=Brevibacterium samyangense TaxID=366888 RepID=A0ABP5EWC0_9MICO
MTLTPASSERAVADDLAAFVHASPTSYHAARTAADRLTAAGFTELAEADAWEIVPGGKYLVVRDGSVLAWVMPAAGGDGAGSAGAGVTGFDVFGAHTDSPAFKLKPKPDLLVEGSHQAGVEVYGGPLLNSWLDRELAFAGRLVLRDGSTVLARTAAIGRIPQLAIHLDREVNQKLTLDKQRHMQPVIGLADLMGPDASAESVLGLLAASAGVTASDVAGYDVFTIPSTEPAVFGAHEEFLASPRLDNLTSVHAGSAAIAGVDPAGLSKVAVFVANDHEEVGSESRSGASGPFLADVLERIVAAGAGAATGAGGAGGAAGAGGREAFLRSMARTFCISSDAGHAVHPNYPERHDPANRPKLGHGPLLKINANQRYSTDAVGTARWAAVCRAAGVDFQEFVSNNAMPCGTTIGPLTATRLGMTTVDVGVALWSMHSAREMCAVSDVAALYRAASAFLSGAA